MDEFSSISNLFRKEALESKEIVAYNAVLINMPFEYSMIGLFSFLLIILLGLVMIVGRFSQQVIVRGYLNYNKGVVTIYPKKNGIVSQVNVTEGMKVSQGDELVVMDTSFSHSNISVEQEFMALARMKKRIARAIAIKKEQVKSFQSLLKKNYFSLYELNKEKMQLAALLNQQETLNMNFFKIKKSQSYTLRSPIDGVVSNVLVKQGQYPKLAKPLLKITPYDAKLEAEIFVPARHLAFLNAQRKIYLHYDTYPYQQFGAYPAILKWISQNMLTDEEEMKPFRIGEPYYKAIAVIDKPYLQMDQIRRNLQQGMAFSAVLTGAPRKIWQWFFMPIYKF